MQLQQQIHNGTLALHGLVSGIGVCSLAIMHVTEGKPQTLRLSTMLFCATCCFPDHMLATQVRHLPDRQLLASSSLTLPPMRGQGGSPGGSLPAWAALQPAA